MNEQTAKLLEQLADKLGTTAEHLWRVLIAQAPISASISLVLWALAAVALIVSWRIAVRFDWKRVDSLCPEIPEGFALGGIICAAVVLIITGICGAPVVVSAFVNPEYWALKEVLK